MNTISMGTLDFAIAGAASTPSPYKVILSSIILESS